MASVFYFHPGNSIAKQLAESVGVKGFFYQNRGQLELRIQQLIAELGYDMWPTFHTVVGGLSGEIGERIPLNPDDEMDKHTLKLTKNKVAWSWIKIINGPRMSQVIGYLSGGSASPFAMSNAEMAQKGIISASYVPRILS